MPPPYPAGAHFRDPGVQNPQSVGAPHAAGMGSVPGLLDSAVPLCPIHLPADVRKRSLHSFLFPPAEVTCSESQRSFIIDCVLPPLFVEILVNGTNSPKWEQPIPQAEVS